MNWYPGAGMLTARRWGIAFTRSQSSMRISPMPKPALTSRSWRSSCASIVVGGMMRTKTRRTFGAPLWYVSLATNSTNWSVLYCTNLYGPFPTVGVWKNGWRDNCSGGTLPSTCLGRM
jgi:hypothetical protein